MRGAVQVFLLDGFWSLSDLILGTGYERRSVILVGEITLAVNAMNGDDGMHGVRVSFSFLLW